MKLLFAISVFIFLTGLFIVLFGEALNIVPGNHARKKFRYILWILVVGSALISLGITVLFICP